MNTGMSCETVRKTENELCFQTKSLVVVISVWGATPICGITMAAFCLVITLPLLALVPPRPSSTSLWLLYSRHSCLGCQSWRAPASPVPPALPADSRGGEEKVTVDCCLKPEGQGLRREMKKRDFKKQLRLHAYQNCPPHKGRPQHHTGKWHIS